MSEEISYIFMWHALSDACEKCRYLNGKEWREQDIFQNVLWDSRWGDIWDFNSDRSLVHPNCRCQLEVRVNVNLEAVPSYAQVIEVIDLRTR